MAVRGAKTPQQAFQRTMPIATSIVGDPIVGAIKARMDPFNALRGSGSCLADGKPSQKFMSKGTSSISIPAGCTMCFMQVPNIASDLNQLSLVVAIQTASGVPFSGPFKNALVGANVVGGGTFIGINTGTPYPYATLVDDYEWASAGAGLRFTYEGAELYRSGTFRYLHDADLSFNNGFGDWTVTGPQDVINQVNSSLNSIRQSINFSNVVEINSFHKDCADYAEGTALSGIPGSTWGTIGGTTGANNFGTRATTLGYYTNTSLAAVGFHVEVIEHWSVTGRQIQSLQTPSKADAQVDTHVIAALDNARQVHATIPNAHHLTVMQNLNKAVKSPIGHAVLDFAIRAALR